MISWAFLALLCIVVGFAEAIFDGHVLFDPIVWFVAAVAFDLLDVPIPFGRKRNDAG